MPRIVLLLVVVVVGGASSAWAAELPVLFVHGFCSSADTWSDTLKQLPSRRYGDQAGRYFEGSTGTAQAKVPGTSATKTFLIDFSDLSGGFGSVAVANVPSRRKGGELKVVIDEIKRLTGAPSVILVAHSLGGLVARAYIEGIAYGRSDGLIGYGRDVASLIMVSTPHQGSPLANISGQPGFEACALADTTNLRELEPASPLVTVLNIINWPKETPAHSIVSNNRRRNSDDVVSVTSQDMTMLPRYSRSIEMRRWLQEFQRDGILHTRVHGEPTTVSLITGIVTDLDNGVVRR